MPLLRRRAKFSAQSLGTGTRLLGAAGPSSPTSSLGQSTGMWPGWPWAGARPASLLAGCVLMGTQGERGPRPSREGSGHGGQGAAACSCVPRHSLPFPPCLQCDPGSRVAESHTPCSADLDPRGASERKTCGSAVCGRRAYCGIDSGKRPRTRNWGHVLCKGPGGPCVGRCGPDGLGWGCVSTTLRPPGRVWPAPALRPNGGCGCSRGVRSHRWGTGHPGALSSCSSCPVPLVLCVSPVSRSVQDVFVTSSLTSSPAFVGIAVVSRSASTNGLFSCLCATSPCLACPPVLVGAGHDTGCCPLWAADSITFLQREWQAVKSPQSPVVLEACSMLGGRSGQVQAAPGSPPSSVSWGLDQGRSPPGAVCGAGSPPLAAGKV